MATEILPVPEEYLPDVIGVIRAGLAAVDTPNEAVDTPNEVGDNLRMWCDEVEEYLARGQVPCSVCLGTGLSLNYEGEPDDCSHCKGNCVELEEY